MESLLNMEPWEAVKAAGPLPILLAVLAVTAVRSTSLRHVHARVASPADAPPSAAPPQTLFLYWLFTPLMVAYRTKRSPDYDVERFFTTEKGCVQFTAPRPPPRWPAVAARVRACACACSCAASAAMLSE
jgi:hypothetical protein